jgi:flagella basal body P-ring formation protein FlgA
MMRARGIRGAARTGLLLSALALAAVVPAAAFAAGPSAAEVLRSHVLENRPWADVELRNLSLDTEPPAGLPRRIVVRKGLPGRTVFAMEYGNGTVVTATADVAAFEEIVVTARPLWKDRPLTEDDVCLSRKEVGKIPPGAIRDPKAVAGKTLTRSVGANLPLLSRYLAGSPLVKRGRKVMLVVESGGMRIATQGETRENAYVDDVVRAVNLASMRTVTGVLVDENTVRVDF